MSVQPSPWLGIHSYRLSSSTAPQKPPPLSCLSHLTSICSMSTSALLLGYFSIHLDSTSCPFASEFLSLLDCFSITQHVKGPNHAKGHTLDLDPPIYNAWTSLFLTTMLSSSLFLSMCPSSTSQNITYRNIKTVNTLALTNILETHLASDPLDTSLDGLVAYNAAVSWGLDSLAPLKTWSHLERLYKRSGLTVHHEAYKDHIRSYKKP